MTPTGEKKPDPPFDPMKDQKTNAPPTMRGMSPREAARLGIWSDGGRSQGIRQKFPYSVTE
jgi:hypothetical protein